VAEDFGGFHHGYAAVVGGVEFGDRVDDEGEFHGSRAEVNFTILAESEFFVGCQVLFMLFRILFRLNLSTDAENC
jgi:hypothetical protein